ncbi:hypothetical protein Tdes44962_MAKER00841 [Teratosphaeria destructans]|uniref:WW domain-containing protein n=1 Tax=Teratosphaeria destructans TaxID=418781 RepID=A0A9W7SKP9_9PEZI|nr:hypothetical protein Tdes44962_MAKER00841 [Teratosphaeria destructans]
MSSQRIPDDAPPSYSQATGSTANAASSSARPHVQDTGHLAVPGATTSGESRPTPAHRRSMEDEQRPLPKGWVRTFDPQTGHQFFVDTTTEPPRSIWHHPYDDEDYLRTLSATERERIEQESLGRGHPPSKEDIIAAHTDEEDAHDEAHHHATTGTAELPPRPADKGKKSFGRKLKDKVTGSTHEERELARKKRAEAEERAYQQHQKVRMAMAKAAETGEPQLIGKDGEGKNVYIEPPAYTGGYGGYGGGYGYNPYGNGLYSPYGRYVEFFLMSDGRCLCANV